MTDYTVQNNDRSGLAWGATGAFTGGLGGAALAKWANFGIPTQAYKSWDEAVAAVNKDDKFIKKQIEKGGEKAANWTKLQENADALKTIKEDLLKAFPEDLRNHADVNKYLDDFAKYNETLSTEAGKILAKVNAGEVIEGLDKTSATLSADVIGYVQKNVDTVKAQKEALEALETKVKGLSGVTDDVMRSFDIDRLVMQRKVTATNLTDDILKTLKKPSLMWTALAGAAILSLGALLVKPKDKQA